MIGNALTDIVAHCAAAKGVYRDERSALRSEQAFQLVGKWTPEYIVHHSAAHFGFVNHCLEPPMMIVEAWVHSKRWPANSEEPVGVAAYAKITKAQFAFRVIAPDHRKHQ